MNQFADTVRDELFNMAVDANSDATKVEIEHTSPNSSDTAEGDSTNIISFKLCFKQENEDGGETDVSHNLKKCAIYCFDNYAVDGAPRSSDIHQILGAKRIRGLPRGTESSVALGTDEKIDSTIPVSMEIDNSDPYAITVKGYYGAQRLTEPYIYLRTSLGNQTKTLETSSLSDGKGTRGNVSHVQSSDIFAKIPVDVEFCHFGSQHGNEYFMNLYNTRHLSNIKFSLTTSHGLPLSDVLVDEKPLNINFTMVLKVDIVEKNAPNERHTADVRRGINPKFSGQIVTEGGLTRDY